MKISIASAMLLFAVAACLGWHDYQRLATVRETHRQLVAEAVRLGMVIDPSRPGDPVRNTQHQRQNNEAEARLVAAEYIAMAMAGEALEKNGGGAPDAAMQKRSVDFMNRLMSLNSTQLKILIAEIRANKDLKDETRLKLLGLSIRTLAINHPQAALAVFTESSDLFKNSRMGREGVASALNRWASDDPLAALAWVRQNAGKYPDYITDDANRGLLYGAASQDPHLAFKLLGELGFKDPASAIQSIVMAAWPPELRTATLAALREHLATVTDEKARAEISNNSVRLLALEASMDGFAAGSQWLAAAHFTPAELVSVANGVSVSSSNSGETGQWIEWLGATLPPGKADDKIKILIRSWTQNDYQAAGKWLSAMPGGPVKNIAIHAYTETVSPYQPEVAAKWALTLPPGKERDATLHNIYQKWPRDDPAAAAAAAAFAKQHGIKE